RLPGAQVHLDLRLPFVQEGEMGEALRYEVCAQFPIEHAQDVAVEGGGQPLRIVVGAVENCAGLQQIGAEQEAIVLVEGGGDPPEKGSALLLGEVPDRAAEKGDQAAPALRHFLQVKVVIAHEPVYAQPVELAKEGSRALAEHGIADVEGNVDAAHTP